MGAHPRFLTVDEVVDLHEAAINRFGGSLGIRDAGMLDSAVHVPQATYGGEWMYQDLFTKAAAYLVHLVLNHPFVDGNKRTAWLAARAFLRLNGYRTKPRQDETVQKVTDLASGESRSIGEISEWLSWNSEPV